MKSMEETKREVINEIKRTGVAPIWNGTLEKYLDMSGDQEDDNSMPEDTPVSVMVVYEDGNYAMRVRYNPDTENEVSHDLEESSSVDNGFWMIVNAYINGTE
jgi:hypothetical protein